MVLTKKTGKIETYFCEKCGKKLLEKLSNKNSIIYDGCSHYIWYILPYDYYGKQSTVEGKKYVEWLKKNKEVMVYTGKEIYFLMKK